MTKGKKLFLIIIGVIIVFLIILTIFIVLKKDESINVYKQKVSMEDNVSEKINVAGIDIKFNRIEFTNGVYHIEIIAKNNTDKVVDLSNYRMSFRNKSEDELDWFRGSMIGELEPDEEVSSYVDSFEDLSSLDHITYFIFDFQY